MNIEEHRRKCKITYCHTAALCTVTVHNKRKLPEERHECRHRLLVLQEKNSVIIKLQKNSVIIKQKKILTKYNKIEKSYVLTNLKICCKK